MCVRAKREIQVLFRKPHLFVSEHMGVSQNSLSTGSFRTWGMKPSFVSHPMKSRYVTGVYN